MYKHVLFNILSLPNHRWSVSSVNWNGLSAQR